MYSCEIDKFGGLMVSCIGIACSLLICLFIVLYCMFYCVGELFVECICYLLYCSCCFVVKSYGVFFVCLVGPFIALPMYGFPLCVCLVYGPIVYLGVPSRCFVLLYEGVISVLIPVCFGPCFFWYVWCL